LMGFHAFSRLSYTPRKILACGSARKSEHEQWDDQIITIDSRS
jgi:hypothetical protein